MLREDFPVSETRLLLDLLTSFPDCLGGAVYELLGLMVTGTLGALEEKFNPFTRPSSPCSSGHS